MKKTLMVYYSRTWITKKIVEVMHNIVDFDVEELVDTKKRSGAIWYLLAGKEATLQKCTKIAPIKYNPAEYDRIIIWTPVWAFTMASAVRTYIVDNQKYFPPTIAFFCTEWWSGHERTFRHMAQLSQKTPVIVQEFLSKEVVSGTYQEKIATFTKTISLS